MELYYKFTAEIKKRLSKYNSYTPYDDLTLSFSNKKLGVAQTYSIINGKDICFFINTLNSTDNKVIQELIDILYKVKKGYSILPSVFVGMANDFCIHNKEVVEVKNKNAVMNRWLMKMVNVSSLDLLRGKTVENNKYVING